MLEVVLYAVSMVSQRPNTRRLAMWVWYRGDLFRGFQSQPEGSTVQQALQRAVHSIGHPSAIVPAGRTDRGVHARMQVVAWRAPADQPPEAMTAQLAAHLPPGLGLGPARWPPAGFHPQWSSCSKEYRYRLCLGAAPPPQWRGGAWAVCQHPRLEGRTVNLEALAAALDACRGARDFIAFHEKSSPRRTRTLSGASLHALGGGLFEVRLVGDGFGRHQARYLVGTVAAVAAGALPLDSLQRALERGEPIDGVRAPAEGLVLWEVRYPPGLDPFTAADRRDAPGVPRVPVFHSEDSSGAQGGY